MKRIFLTALVICTNQTFACGEITPNKEITKIVTRLAYSDFPKAADIFAIIRNESSFDPNALPPLNYDAVDKNGKDVSGSIKATSKKIAYAKLRAKGYKSIDIDDREPSVGLMQVQNGSLDPRENVAQGVAKLREYYKLTGSIKGAVESYNIGPSNFLNKKLTLSGEAYYLKYKLQRRVYIHWPEKKLVNLGETLGCKKENGVPDWLQAALVKDAPDEIVEAARLKVNVKH